MGRGLGIKKRKRPLSKQTIGTAQAIAKAIRDCGLSKVRIHEVTGVDPGAISKVLTGKHYTAQLKTIVDLLYTAGYEIKLEKIDPYEDPYYYERQYPPPPLPPKEEKEG